MDRQEYIEFILDHYNNPREKGAIGDPDILVNGGNPGCGDVVTVYAKLDDDDRITDIKWEGQGCTISMGAASLLMEKVKGKTLKEVEAMDYDVLIDELGREVVQSRLRCATLAMDTLKSGAMEYPTHKALGRKLVAPIVLAHTFRTE